MIEEIKRTRSSVEAEYRVYSDDLDEAKNAAIERFMEEMVPEGENPSVEIPHGIVKASGPSFDSTRWTIPLSAEIG